MNFTFPLDAPQTNKDSETYSEGIWAQKWRFSSWPRENFFSLSQCPD